MSELKHRGAGIVRPDHWIGRTKNKGQHLSSALVVVNLIEFLTISLEFEVEHREREQLIRLSIGNQQFPKSIDKRRRN